MLLFAFTGVMRASAEQGNVRADQVIEQGFEDGLGDWTLNHCHSSSGVSSAYTTHSGSNVFRFYYTTNYPQYLISPEFDEENGGGNITFYVARYSGNYPETYKVGYSFTTNDPSEFTWNDEVTCTTIYSSGYDEVSYDLPAGVKYVAIACTSNDQFYMFVDDITVTLTPPAAGGTTVEVTIGDPTSTTTNSYLPGYTLYEYAISQQIYTADEIGVAGSINTLTVWLKNTSSYARNINVYMKEVEATEFASNTAWESFAAADMVASFTMPNQNTDPIEVALPLNTPFEYSGTNSLAICFQDVTGQWSNGLGGVVMDANGNQAIYAYRDGTSYDVSNPGVNGTLLAKKNVIRLAIMTGGGAAGPAIVSNPDIIDLGFRPNGYWMAPYTFELYNQGTEGTVTEIISENPFFELNAELPYTLPRHESMYVEVTTGYTDAAGEKEALLEVQYEGEGLDDTSSTYVYVAATAYEAVTPDVWELAEEVTAFPFQTTTTMDDLYLNYNLPGIKPEAKDAVYMVTFDNDVMFSAGTNGTDHVTAIYPEGFNGMGGPGNDNNYVYTGPEVNPGPISMWFNYNYTGGNTFFGNSSGGGMYFGYRITSAQLQELGLGNCAITIVEAAARAGSYYDLVILKGGDTPDLDNMVYYQPFDAYTPNYFFDINLDEPQFLGDDENIWIMLYSDSPYAAYCGKSPINAENGKIWYTFDQSSWYSNTNYTPQIFCRFIEIPTGREVTMNLANMEIKSNPNVENGEVAEASGEVKGVSKAQKHNEIAAMNNRGRDLETLLDEGFEGGEMPTGWTTEGNGTWSVGTGDYSSSTGAATGSYNAKITHGTTGNDTYLVTPAMDLSNATSATVSCNYINRSWSGDTDGFGIYYRVDGGDWNELFATSSANNSWTASGDIVLTGLAANYQIGFKHVDNYGYGVGLDDVLVIADMEAGDPTAPQYQISNMYVPAGTYYVVVASSSEDFQVDMDVADVPAPEQAVVVAPYDEESNVEDLYLAEWILGDYTKEMQVLYGTDYPPTTALIEWTDYLVESAFISSLDHNRTYFFQVNERNDSGVTEGEIISFKTPLDKVQGVDAPVYVYTVENITLSWNAIEDEGLLGYNVYKDGVLLNETLITNAYYQLGNLEYNLAGWCFNVTAVYEAGESAFSADYFIYVSGFGNIAGYVYEQDGVTPIEGAYVKFQGTNDFGQAYGYGVYTNEEGYYNAQLVAGYYDNIYAAKAGYQTAYQTEEYSLAYQEEIESVNFILDEEFYGVDYVDATEELPYPRISWGNYLLKADFEEGIPEGWTMIDADGDGYNWSLKSNGGHESDQSVISASWIYGVGAVSPDNYLVTPQIPLGGKLSFWARSNDASYSAEHFGLAVSTGSNDNPEDFTMLQEWTMTAKRGGDSADRNNMNRGTRGYEGEWYEYEVDLSAYEGQNGYVAIRHFNTYDMFELNVDDVIVDNRNYTGDRSFEKYRIYRTAYDNVGPYNTENTTLVGEIISGSFIYDESFDEVEEGLYKYGVSVVYEGNRDGALNEFTETFDEGLPENWTMIDADYDGRCWMLGSEASLGFGHGHNGSNDMMISKSFENGSSVYPDNYLVSPLVQFGNQSRFEFYACAQDANYPEYVGVAVSTSGNEYAYDFATIAEWQVDNERSQGIWHKYVVELDQYAGQEGYIAIRHFNSSYNFYLDIDDVSFYDIDVQLPRESAILWSDGVGKGMYLTDGAVDITVTLASGDAPEDIVATFKNLTQPEIEDIVVNLDENGYYSFDSFRKGGYEITLTKADYYDEVGTYYIMEPTSLEFMMYEIWYAPRNLKVSHTGYATWDAPQSSGRHLEDDMYNLYLYDVNDGSLLWYQTVYDKHGYIPEDMLTDGVTYVTKVRGYYTASGGGLYPSELATCTWTYRSCDHYVGANNLKAKPLDEGVYMTWEYPVVDEGNAGNRDAWDLLTSFNATSSRQYGIVTDGNYIYTSSWSSSSTSMFYRYDLDGNFIDEFDIEGCGQLRDMTYDGQYFYGVACTSTVYCVDLANHTLINTFDTEYGSMRGITYDSERDGFWVIGNWSGDLTLIDRYGNIVFTGPTPMSASGLAYYVDNTGVEHVLMPQNGSGIGYVYDYNIVTNTISDEPVCDLTVTLTEFTGSTGGCHVGIYNGKMAFFADVQEDPQLIGIYELDELQPSQPIGANIYLYDELVGFTTDNHYMFEGYGQYDSFSLRVVYDNYDMSCMQYAEMINRYWIYTYAYPSNGGTVTESALYYEGDTCTLTAEAFEDFDFVRWEDAWYGGVVSEDPTYNFVVTRETEFMARYVTDSYYNDVNLYENNMNVIGLIKIEGEEQTNLFLEIGAFCDYECRGHQRLKYYPQVDRYLVYLTISGNEGDQIDFHLYNNEWGGEMSMICPNTITFEADAVLGTPFEPYEFNFYEAYWNEQYDEFNNGWNWWSTYIEQGGSYNGLADLQAYLTNSGYMISSQTGFTMNYGTYGWYGSLNSITNESMYKIKMNQAGYSDLYYYNARPDLHPITVVPGWNYIGYVSDYEMDLNEALMGLEPSDGDMIKSQYAYANYYEGYGWFGSLNYMEPGKGYMYKAADSATFIYGQGTRGITKENLTAENNHWVPNANAYKDNMTIMAVVNLNEVELVSDNYELAAFVDGECRGSVRLTYAEPLNRYVAFLTVAGEDVTTLRFGLYDEATGAECYSNDIMEFNSDVVAGNPNEPVVISFSGMNDNSGFMVYPNPVAKGEHVNLVLPTDSQSVRVEVSNALGEIVSVETITKSQASIALPSVSGVYTIRIITDNKDTDFKKVIVK